jgi:glycosyltransferase involved in cell wall biosynthesis
MLGLARSIARRGHSVAIIAYGEEGELPAQVEAVSIVRRAEYKTRDRLTGKVSEAVNIWRALHRARAEAVITRCAGVQVGLAAIYARVARRRLIFSSAADADFEPSKLLANRRDRALYGLGIRLSHTIVVQSEEQQELCRKAFRRNAVVIKSMAAPAQRQPATAPEAFLWLGRVATYKRPIDYIALARALPEAEFWMVAVPGVPGTETHALAKQLAVEVEGVRNLRMLPPRSHDEIGVLLDRAVASVNTSDFEGMPNALLEGWARGVPALVLRHDPGGVVAAHDLGAFAAGAFDAFVQQARQQWATRHDRAPLAARCQSYVAQHHAPDVIAERWVEVIEGR